MKCDGCLNSRRIISENGLHSICCLSEKKAMDCIMGKKEFKISVKYQSKETTDVINRGESD